MSAFGRAMAGSAVDGRRLRARCRGSPVAAEQPTTVMTFGGTYKTAIEEAFGKPFTQKTGMPVQYQEPYNFAKIRAMHQAKAQQIDATLAITEQVLYVVESKMATPIDWSVVDRSALSPVQSFTFPNLVGFVVQSNLLCSQQEEGGPVPSTRTPGRISGTSRNFQDGARCGAPSRCR